jgi:hypothetical protein
MFRSFRRHQVLTILHLPSAHLLFFPTLANRFIWEEFVSACSVMSGCFSWVETMFQVKWADVNLQEKMHIVFR